MPTEQARACHLPVPCLPRVEEFPPDLLNGVNDAVAVGQ